jgi:hypothetical protein
MTLIRPTADQPVGPHGKYAGAQALVNVPEKR